MVETNDSELEDVGNPRVRVCEIVREEGSCGFNLTKSKWDPYPWVSNVECGSPAEIAGIQPGDCLLEVNGEDVLGLRVVEVANRVKARDEKVTVMLWNAGVDPKCTPEALCCGPMPTNLQRLSTCMSNILASLECPICLDTIPPPAHQCANGHLICLNCRVRTERCPVCRMKFFRGRSLLADQVFNSLIDAFDLRDKEESKRPKMLRQKLCGGDGKKKKAPSKPEIKVNFLSSPTNKLLTRLMKSGKASSAENLSENLVSDPGSLSIPSESDFYSGLKAKSLSSSEIFRPDLQPLSRTGSVLSNRPGSGLLDVRPLTLSKRPASYHGSSEDLQSRLFNDFGIEFSVPKTDRNCNCPCDSECPKSVTSLTVMKHVQEYHEGPVIYFFKPKIEINLPLTYPSSTVITITAYNTLFVVKIIDYAIEKKNNRIWIWNVNDTGRFNAAVTLFGESGVVISSQCPVVSLISVNWEQVVANNCGILFNLNEKNIKIQVEIFLESEK